MSKEELCKYIEVKIKEYKKDGRHLTFYIRCTKKELHTEGKFIRLDEGFIIIDNGNPTDNELVKKYL
jgi:hypothetical protein